MLAQGNLVSVAELRGPHLGAIFDVEKALATLDSARREFQAAVQIAVATAAWLEGLGRGQDAGELVLRTLTLASASGLYQPGATPDTAHSPSNEIQLSPRECDVLRLVCRGSSNKGIAKQLAITPETVKAHIKRIFMKLQVTTRAAAAYRASAHGLV